MKKFLMVLLHLIGFPLLIGIVVWKSMPIINAGISYGLMAFVGIIFTVVLALVYYLAFLILSKSKKKSVYRQTITLALIAFIMLGGLWGVLDIAAPELLADATSNTIYYEDLTDDYEARVAVNENLLDLYIQRNVANGNLSELTEEEYLTQGIRNEEVAALLDKHFESIDAGGYKTFEGPWIDMANDDRLTMAVLVHLIIDDRTIEQEYPYPLYNELEKKILEDPVTWSVLDMMGTPMDFEIAIIGENIIFQGAANAIVNKVVEKVGDKEYTLLDIIPEALSDPAILGSPIFIKMDTATGTLSLIPSNEIRGVLDYQSMAWLDSNGLIYMLLSVLGLRRYFLIFAGVIMITTYFIGLLREDKKSGKKGKSEGTIDPRASLYADPSFKVEQHRVDAFRSSGDSFITLDGSSDLDYAAMSLQLMKDRQAGVQKKYSGRDF